MFAREKEGLALFDTSIGRCGLAWTRKGVDHLVLPAASAEATVAELRLLAQKRYQAESQRRSGTTVRQLWKRPPPSASRVINRIQAHLKGQSDAMRDVPLDLRGTSEFFRQVCKTLRRVPPGQVVSYTELARRCGQPGAARAIGRVMAANPVPLLVPCHRVVTADGKLGGYSAVGGTVLKSRILFAEGVVLDPAMQAGMDHLSRIDPVLRKIIRRAGPYSPLLRPPADPYENLLLAIINQQLSLKAGATIARRVRELTPGPDMPTPAEVSRLPDEQLRGAGLSHMKVSFVRDLAAHVADGRLDLRSLRRLSDQEVMAALVNVRGIGRWSAEIFLIFQLGRLDILPVDDVGLRNAVGKAYGLANAPTASELLELGEKWRPYRSMASWYLWWSLG